ncbi:MAG: Retaining alpha-galactosidase, partial [Sphingobacteriaceae bacterium]
MIKLRNILFLCLFFWSAALWAQPQKHFSLKSPDGKISLNINTAEQIKWDLALNDQTEIITPSAVSLTLSNGEVLGKNPVVQSARTNAVNQYFNTPIYKKSRVHDQYNQLTLTFKGDYGLIFRAYDDGAAYRFFTRKKGMIKILNEEASFNFKADDKAYFPFVNDYRNKDKYTTSFEALYKNLNLSAVTKDSLAFLPILVDVGNGKKAAILEADLENYPGMYLTGNGQNNPGLQAAFAHYPTQEQTGGYANMNYVVKKRADFIAETDGSRSYPWRAVIVSTEDKQLANSDMVQKLASPSRIAD